MHIWALEKPVDLWQKPRIRKNVACPGSQKISGGFKVGPGTGPAPQAAFISQIHMPPSESRMVSDDLTFNECDPHFVSFLLRKCAFVCSSTEAPFGALWRSPQKVQLFFSWLPFSRRNTTPYCYVVADGGKKRWNIEKLHCSSVRVSHRWKEVCLNLIHE